jgi:hypothetical protein
MEEDRIVLKFGKENGALLKLNQRFKERIKVSRDRVWLTGPGDDVMWQDHLMDVLKAVA